MESFYCWLVVALEFVIGFFFVKWLVRHNNIDVE
jgi:hypothetical protein